MENQQQIIDKIDSILDGEIKKLEFGCKITTISGNTYPVLKADESTLYLLRENGERTWVYTKNIVKIIGKPITLKLLLQAINEVEPIKYGITTDGWFYKRDTFVGEFKGLKARFNTDLPDDLIKQCKANKDLEDFIIKIFDIT